MRKKKADASTGKFRKSENASLPLLFHGKAKKLKPTLQNILNNPHLFSADLVAAAHRHQNLAR